MKNRIRVFSGSATAELGDEICRILEIEPSRTEIKKFEDGEIFVHILENIRAADVFVIQSMAPPVNENLMELLIMIDTLKRASASSITAVVPYYCYARQDRKADPRTPITSKLVADLYSAAGATRIVSMDLHADQIQGFFNIPFDHLFATPVFLKDMRKRFEGNYIFVSPDAGGVKRARAYAKRTGSDIAFVEKHRPEQEKAEALNVVGDVAGRDCIIVDDIISSGRSLVEASRSLRSKGASRVFAYIVHPVLSGTAVSNLMTCPEIEDVTVTDTLPLRVDARSCRKLRVLSIAEILAETVKRISNGDSLSSLFV